MTGAVADVVEERCEIVISCVPADAAEVEEIAAALEQRGRRTVLDHDLSRGSDPDALTTRSFDEADLVVLYLSPRFLASPALPAVAKRAFGRHVDAGVTVVTVTDGRVTVPDFLGWCTQVVPQGCVSGATERPEAAVLPPGPEVLPPGAEALPPGVEAPVPDDDLRVRPRPPAPRPVDPPMPPALPVGVGGQVGVDEAAPEGRIGTEPVGWIPPAPAPVPGNGGTTPDEHTSRQGRRLRVRRPRLYGRHAPSVAPSCAHPTSSADDLGPR
ncbi:MAG: TIR domain-containing protein [Actinomycetota bacterium]|nr:TIR domain-containing protein [Actinomycetota bacterium]